MIAEDPGFLGDARPDAFLGGVGEQSGSGPVKISRGRNETGLTQSR
jgi:hypothetical protein